MSFALTVDQIRSKTKTVTRRCGWWFLGVGEEIIAVNKTMGFKKGEHPVHLARLRVVSARPEPLHAITAEDVKAEGFATHPMVKGSPSAFVAMFCQTHKDCTPETIVNRIEFDYLT